MLTRNLRLFLVISNRKKFSEILSTPKPTLPDTDEMIAVLTEMISQNHKPGCHGLSTYVLPVVTTALSPLSWQQDRVE